MILVSSRWKNARSLLKKKKDKNYFDKKKSIRYSSVMKYLSPPKTIMNIHLAESHFLSKLTKRPTVFVLHRYPRMTVFVLR